jgi:hypothetical protein
VVDNKLVDDKDALEEEDQKPCSVRPKDICQDRLAIHKEEELRGLANIHGLR